MALEAGRAMHDVFAAMRLWQLGRVQKRMDHANVNGIRLFGAGRWQSIWAKSKGHDARDSAMAVAFETLHTSGFEDDEFDSVRTRANMELATIVYIDERLAHMDNWPIYVKDGKDAHSMCGVEQTFDVVLEYADGGLFRYAGTIDGAVIKAATGRLFLEENKTAARLDNGWRAAFDMSHQVTGYNFCSTTVFGEPVTRSRITGLKIKPTHKGEDIWVAELERDASSLVHWAAYVRQMIALYETHFENWENAPRFTHSCNRYFRPCSLLSFCADTPKGRIEQWKQMVPADKSPTEQGIE